MHSEVASIETPVRWKQSHLMAQFFFLIRVQTSRCYISSISFNVAVKRFTSRAKGEIMNHDRKAYIRYSYHMDINQQFFK